MSKEAPRTWPVLVDSLEILRRYAPQNDMAGAGGNLGYIKEESLLTRTEEHCQRLELRCLSRREVTGIKIKASKIHFGRLMGTYCALVAKAIR